LFAFDTASNQQILVLDWQVPNNRIETIILLDGTYTYNLLAANLFSLPGFLGNFSWSSSGILPPGVTGAEIDEALSFYTGLSQDLEAGNLGTNANGTLGSDDLAGSSFDDKMNGLAGSDSLSGRDGDDFLIGGSGSDSRDGGSGLDVAGFTSSRGEHVIAPDGSTVQHGADVDTLVSIEGRCFREASYDGAYQVGQVQFADVNGDGRTDAIFQTEDNRFWLSLSNGDGLDPAFQAFDHGLTFQEGQIQFAEVNGDGFMDMIMQGTTGKAVGPQANGTQADGNPFQGFWVSYGSESGFQGAFEGATHGGTFERGRVQYADIDGDGYADLIAQYTTAKAVGPSANGLQADGKPFQGFWVNWGSESAGFKPGSLEIATHGGSFQEGQVQYADIDGDGRDDLVMQATGFAIGDDGQPLQGFWVSTSTGSGFGNPYLAINDHAGPYMRGQAQYADINADGRDDLMVQLTEGTEQAIYVSLSNLDAGEGRYEWDAPVRAAAFNGSYQEGQVHYADINGDNRADLVAQDDSNHFRVAFSNGATFGARQDLFHHVGDFERGQAAFADVNGDGADDLLFLDDDNDLYLSVAGEDLFT